MRLDTGRPIYIKLHDCGEENLIKIYENSIVIYIFEYLTHLWNNYIYTATSQIMQDIGLILNRIISNVEYIRR